MPWRTVRMSGHRGNIARLNPWYLYGGILLENCVAAYQPKGAASYAASKVNLVNPGTFDLSNGAAFPTWTAADGWNFDQNSSQYLSIASAIVTAAPLTIVCRFAANSVAAAYCVACIANNAAPERFAIYADGTDGGDPIGAYTITALVGFPFAASTSGFTLNNWHTGCAVYSAPNSRAAFIDGGSKGTDATAATPLGVNTTLIGAVDTGGVLNHFFGGDMAAVSFYNIALSDAQVLAIHNAMVAL